MYITEHYWFNYLIPPKNHKDTNSNMHAQSLTDILRNTSLYVKCVIALGPLCPGLLASFTLFFAISSFADRITRVNAKVGYPIKCAQNS